MTMSRRDPTVLLALILALAAHLALLGVGVRAARRDLGWWLSSQPAKTAPTPTAPIVAPRPNDDMQRLGDHDTNGTSINASQGDVPMESMVADARQEQAMMQRDPAGFGGKGNNRQLEKVLRGDNGDNRQQGSNSAAQSAASVFGSQESSLADLTPKMNTPVPVKVKPDNGPKGQDNPVDPLSRGPLPVGDAKTNMLTPTPQPKSDNNQQAQNQQDPTNAAVTNNTQASANGGKGGKPGSADPGAGNPIPTSDFESYPVTHVASRFRAGRLEAQSGRKMRTRELPRLGVAAYADLESMFNPSVVLLLKIDTSGNVTDAQIEHSSGSDNVDLPCQRAAYTWWFEPLKDPQTGQARPETIEFTINFSG